MKGKKRNFKVRKVYQKPEVCAVKLESQETVLQNCKAATGSFKKSGRCMTAANCGKKTIGS